MISGDVDLRRLERELLRLAADFGEVNQTGIARWGVGVARRLVVSTQAWGDGKDSKENHQQAMMKDGYRAVYVVKNPDLIKKFKKGTLTGVTSGGTVWTFRPHQMLRTPQAVNDWIDMNRTTRKKRVPELPSGVKCVTTEKIFMAAMRIRFRRIGQAKGGWIGAGQEIARFQKAGSRIAIGKNVAGYAHKFKGGGSGTMKKSTWSPEGKIENRYPHVSSNYVLKRSDITKALEDGARNIIQWYERAMQGRLNRRR